MRFLLGAVGTIKVFIGTPHYGAQKNAEPAGPALLSKN
jgi:hypothetical protein